MEVRPPSFYNGTANIFLQSSSLNFSPSFFTLHYIFCWSASAILSYIRYMYTPTAFRIATTFNADLSKWNTAAVITLHWSTSTAYLHISFASVFISAVHFVLLCLFTQSHPFLFFYMYIPLKFSYVQHLKKLINSMQISQSGTRQR